MKLGLLDGVKKKRIIDGGNIENPHIHVERMPKIQYCSETGKSFVARLMEYENPKNGQLYYLCQICSKKGKGKKSWHRLIASDSKPKGYDEQAVFTVIRKKPGATYYDISKALNWDVKKVKRTAAKLEATGRVQLIESERNHRKIIQVFEIDKPRPTSRNYPNYQTWYYKGEYLSRDEAYRKYFDDCDMHKRTDKPGRSGYWKDPAELWSVNPSRSRKWEARYAPLYCIVCEGNGTMIEAIGPLEEMQARLTEAKPRLRKEGYQGIEIKKYR
jgi:hypothetical protein